MKLIQRQGSYENEILLSTSASEEDIKLALLTIDSITTVELVVEDVLDLGRESGVGT